MILILLGVSILICLCIISLGNIARKEIMEMSINNVDSSKIKDGEYSGHFKNRLQVYDVSVTVKNNTITRIKSINNSPTNSYNNELFDRVIKQQ